MYFGNYQKLVYLAQTEQLELQQQAQAAAERLGLNFEYRFNGYGELKTQVVQWINRSTAEATPI